MMGGPSGWLTLNARHAGDTVVYGYVVEKTEDPNYSRVFRLTVEIKGPRPSRVRSPQGWTSSLSSVRPGDLWGCTWRIEWKIDAGSKGAQPPVAGFFVAFQDAAPKSSCFAELEGNGMDTGITGPDATSARVS